MDETRQKVVQNAKPEEALAVMMKIADREGLITLGVKYIDTNPGIAYLAFAAAGENDNIRIARQNYLDAEDLENCYHTFRKANDKEGLITVRERMITEYPLQAYYFFGGLDQYSKEIVEKLLGYKPIEVLPEPRSSNRFRDMLGAIFHSYSK